VVDDPTPNLGDEVVWTIEVVNNGPDTAVNVVVEDLLPAGTSFVASSNEDFDPETGQLVIGDLEASAMVSFDITVMVNDADGPRVNTATVTSDTFDNNESNNSAVAEVDAVGTDLRIEKSVDNEAPDLGANVVWTITVYNDGPDLAENVMVADALPEGVAFVSTTAEDFDEATLTAALGDLAVGDSASFDIVVTVNDAAMELTNEATVSSDTVEVDDTNNTAESTIDAVAVDLSLDKGVIPDTAAVSDTVVWTIRVDNAGPDDATGIVVEDVLPSGVTYVSHTEGADFDPDSGIWNVGSLEAEGSIELMITATVNETGDLTNVAEITAADQFDPDSTPGNNVPAEDDQDSATLTLLPSLDAVSDQFQVQLVDEPLNAVIMVDHSGSMGGDTIDQNPSALAGDIARLDGTMTSRLQIIREAVEQFAQRDEISSIKILGFDGTADPISPDIPAPFSETYVSMPHDNVSEWFDVSGQATNDGLVTFLGDLRASGFTNYADALVLSEEFFELDVDGNPEPVPNDGAVNYYFLTDGTPLSSNENSPTPAGDALAAWETFAGDTFNEAFGIGFGGGATVGNLPNLDLVSISDGDPNTTGEVVIDGEILIREEENTIVTSSAAEIPAELIKTIADTVAGNVFDGDTGENGALQPGDASVTSISIDGTEILASDGNFDGFLESGALFEFDFSDGSFEYFAPNVDELFTETIEYTIEDASGNTDTAEIIIEILPTASDEVTESAAATALVVENDDIFTDGVVANVPSVDSDTDREWAGEDTLYDGFSYDVSSQLVV